jgi:hypothetical protein
LSTNIGMRHRAAIGLSEETDAIIIVVSEETGQISAARAGHLEQGLDVDGLRLFLAQTLSTQPRQRNWFVDRLRQLIASLISARSATNPALPAEGFSEPVATDTTPAEPPVEEIQQQGQGHS